MGALEAGVCGGVGLIDPGSTHLSVPSHRSQAAVDRRACMFACVWKVPITDRFLCSGNAA